MKHKAVTKQTGLRRILKLAARVAKVRPHRFNFNQFVGYEWKKDPQLSCGTAACAFGWATTMPLFRRLGLFLNRRSNEPQLGRIKEFAVIAKRIFGITSDEAYKLFIPGHGQGYSNDGKEVTPKSWAAFARKFVADKQNESA